MPAAFSFLKSRNLTLPIVLWFHRLFTFRGCVRSLLIHRRTVNSAAVASFCWLNSSGVIVCPMRRRRSMLGCLVVFGICIPNSGIRHSSRCSGWVSFWFCNVGMLVLLVVLVVLRT